MLLTGAWHIGMTDSLKFESNAFLFLATYLSDGLLFNFISMPGFFFTISQMIQTWSPTRQSVPFLLSPSSTVS